MIRASRYAREHDVPYLGLCFGMQAMVVEYARFVLGSDDANSSEFDIPTRHPVIDFMQDQRGVGDKGGTMRLGAYPARLREGSVAATAYGATEISERHRHRWEVSNAYRDQFAEHGLRLSGRSPDGGLVEIIELPNHPWYLGCQFHPELKSRPTRPHPLFAAFVGAARRRGFGDREPSLGARQELLGAVR